MTPFRGMLLTPLMPDMDTYRHRRGPEMARNGPLNGTLFRGAFGHLNTTILVVFGTKGAPLDHLYDPLWPGPVQRGSQRGSIPGVGPDTLDAWYGLIPSY